jgi:uncharacterized protein (UPF0261 family)
MDIYLVATLDTKGIEAGFLCDQLASHGLTVHVIDVGCQGVPIFTAKHSREEVFREAGSSLAEIVAKGDRGEAVSRAAAGAAALVARLHAAGGVSGIIGLGGSAGTTIASAAMRALPLGVPKVLISTLASGQVRPYVQDKDIFMLNSVLDISGINRISRVILSEAARALAGMVLLSGQGTSPPPQALPSDDRPLIAATMFGVTTPCVTRAREILEAHGYEVLVFHATGNGGRAMESLIADGLIAGVLDITTTELADELVGGTLSAGADRLTAAGRQGVPQVISVGAIDMVNFGPRETVPTKFQSRLFYQHNANVTLMRTTPDENRLLGEEIGRKASAATGPTTIFLPLQGVSAIDAAEKPFDSPAAREALFEGVRRTRGETELIELDCHINDPEFAEAAARKLLALMKREKEEERRRRRENE